MVPPAPRMLLSSYWRNNFRKVTLGTLDHQLLAHYSHNFDVFSTLYASVKEIQISDMQQPTLLHQKCSEYNNRPVLEFHKYIVGILIVWAQGMVNVISIVSISLNGWVHEELYGLMGVHREHRGWACRRGSRGQRGLLGFSTLWARDRASGPIEALKPSRYTQHPAHCFLCSSLWPFDLYLMSLD